MRINRMLAITMMMLNRDRVTARELAGKFDVSIRTIYRDLEAIDLAGIPVISYSGNKGGYGIMDTYCIDRQYLTFDDIVSMVSTLRGINTALENRELDMAIEKITSLVPGRAVALLAAIVFTQSPLSDILKSRTIASPSPHHISGPSSTAAR